MSALADSDAPPVRAISVDGTSSTVALFGANGEPRTPALMYDDTRARDEADRIAAVAAPDSPARGRGSALAKLLYLSRQASGGTAAHALHQADWISGRLAARFGVADENNVLKMGYDPVRRQWPSWLQALPLNRSLLPDVVPAGTVLGTIDADIAARLGLPSDCLIVSGTTDSNAATLAAGVSAIADAVTSLGSTLVLKVLSEQPVTSSRHGVYSHRIGDRWLTGGASNSGGAVLRHFFSTAQITELSQRIDPRQPSALAYYPLLSPGERFPHNDPDLAPVLEPRPADDAAFLHGLLEGIGRIEKAGYDCLAELGAPYPMQVFSSGGGAVNSTWLQIRQRILGVPVVRAQQAEAAYGSALLARNAVRLVG
jgi:sugar (pentulose or hexulose) kinase